jgi:hypothetical protein
LNKDKVSKEVFATTIQRGNQSLALKMLGKPGEEGE